MKINKTNFDDCNFELFDLSIRKKEVDGGITTKNDIDMIQDFPDAKSIVISGLKQDTFEYFIEHYGQQFEAISLWKNKLVKDLSPLSDLSYLQYFNYFFNQKVTNLWNMKNNDSLIGLSIYEFSKLHKIDEIVTAPNLEYFSIGNLAGDVMRLESLEPISRSSIKHFSWCGTKVFDNDFLCLSKSKIERLDVLISQFKMEELAKLVASFPELKGTATIPYWEGSVTDINKERTTYYGLCKGKRMLKKGEDDIKLKLYLEEFEELVKKYRNQQKEE